MKLPIERMQHELLACLQTASRSPSVHDGAPDWMGEDSFALAHVLNAWNPASSYVAVRAPGADRPLHAAVVMTYRRADQDEAMDVVVDAMGITPLSYYLNRWLDHTGHTGPCELKVVNHLVNYGLALGNEKVDLGALENHLVGSLESPGRAAFVGHVPAKPDAVLDTIETDKPLRALAIDPRVRTVCNVRVGSGIDDIYKVISARSFDVARVSDAPDESVYVDDEGLISNPTDFFACQGYPQPLAGVGLVLGTDEEGESISTTLTPSTFSVRFYTVDELQRILDAQQEQGMTP